MKTVHIAVMKETRANEQRVALTPNDTAELIQQGHTITIEKLAGHAAGFTDADYELAGAHSTANMRSSLSIHPPDIVLRVKRPDHTIESDDIKAIPKGTALLGALDPGERNATHIEAYKNQGIQAYSLDAASLPPTHPLNILTPMSKMAGEMALQDAMDLLGKNLPSKVVIVGFGTAGKAATDEAFRHGHSVTVIASNTRSTIDILNRGGQHLTLNPSDNIDDHRKMIHAELLDADIVITSARRPKQQAPLLITQKMINSLTRRVIFVDLALSEGGNIAGSQHDQTIKITNGSIITNTSGYPKRQPHQASIHWSRASRYFVEQFAIDDASNILHQLRIS